jgi:hypothetical protein
VLRILSLSDLKLLEIDSPWIGFGLRWGNFPSVLCSRLQVEDEFDSGGLGHGVGATAWARHGVGMATGCAAVWTYHTGGATVGHVAACSQWQRPLGQLLGRWWWAGAGRGKKWAGVGRVQLGQAGQRKMGKEKERERRRVGPGLR